MKIVFTLLLSVLTMIAVYSQDNAKAEMPGETQPDIELSRIGDGGGVFQDDLRTVGDQNILITRALECFAVWEPANGRRLLDSLLAEDCLNVQANYLRSELYILYGDTSFTRGVRRLREAGAEKELTILRVKEGLLIGDPDAVTLAGEALQIYPGNAELEFALWLHNIDHGGFREAAGTAHSLSTRLIFPHLPYQALFDYASDFDPVTALAYLDTLEAMVGSVYHSRNRELLELLSTLEQETSAPGEYELEYADCGPGMGFYMTAANGSRIKVELDTGTGGGLFTIHSDSTGKALGGIDTLTVPEGIWYNYMAGPEDMHYSVTAFRDPPIKNFLTGYFKGRFSKADGCFSPFIFKGYALSIDPVNRSAYLRNRESLDNYLNSLKDYTEVDYILRNGWIYIPVKVNGKEVVMMVETGSRYVNLNSIAAKRLGVTPYSGTIKWRGEDYPVEMIDFNLEIGNIEHYVKGGMISDFVLGNTYVGLASAGDIGPDFLRNYAFTIDPFRKKLILEVRDEK
ncbi:MAG: aspartyl protease family protein [Bacteroidales bacterium]